MKALKKTISALALAATLTIAPAPKANAGIILVSVGVGIIFIVMGAVNDDLFLLILDGNDQQSQVQQILAERHSFIDDQQALNDLAAAITNKITNAGEITEEVEIKLSEEEILNILAPTGLIELEPVKVQALIADLT